MLKTVGDAGEAGDVKTGWVRLSTSPPLRLITSDEAGGRRASVVAGRQRSPLAQAN